MKLITIFLPVVLSTLVASKSSSFFGGEQRVLDDDQSVPGDNPLQYCQAATTKDILTIDYVNLKPNPPAKSVDYTFKRRALLTANITQRCDTYHRSQRQLHPRGCTRFLRELAGQIRSNNPDQFEARSL